MSTEHLHDGPGRTRPGQSPTAPREAGQTQTEAKPSGISAASGDDVGDGLEEVPDDGTAGTASGRARYAEPMLGPEDETPTGDG